MGLTPWTWVEPNPVVGDSTLILASHINDIREAIDNTRENVLDNVAGHAMQHTYGGSDPIVGNIMLGDYKFYGMRGLYNSSDPSAKSAYLSNNARLSSAGIWTHAAAVNSNVLSVSVNGMELSSLSGNTLTNILSVNTSTGGLTLDGTATLTGLAVNGNASVSGSLSTGSIAGDVTADNITVNTTLTCNGTATFSGTLNAGTINVTQLNANAVSGLTLNTITSDYITLKGMLLNTSDSETYARKMITLYGLPDAPSKLVISPMVQVGGVRRHYEILVTDNDDTYDSVAGALDISALTLHLQTKSFGQAQNIAICNGTLGGGTTSVPAYVQAYINGHTLIYDADAGVSMLRFYPSSTTSNMITWDSSTFSIYGHGTTGSRTTNIFDHLIVGDGTTAGDILSIPSTVSAALGDAPVKIGDASAKNLCLFNDTVQAQNASLASPLRLNPNGGDINVFDTVAASIVVNGSILANSISSTVAIVAPTIGASRFNITGGCFMTVQGNTLYIYSDGVYYKLDAGGLVIQGSIP